MYPVQNRLAILFLFTVSRLTFLNVCSELFSLKNFQGCVCCLLFSYQSSFCFAVVCDSSFRLSHLFEFVNNFFWFNLFCFCDALSRKALSLSDVNNITTKAESQALFYNFFHSFNYTLYLMSSPNLHLVFQFIFDK